MRRQLYIDPFYVSGNVMKVMLHWDVRTRMTLVFSFPGEKVININRFQQIGFVLEFLRKQDVDLMMTKNEFINLHFDKKINRVDFQIEDIIF